MEFDVEWPETDPPADEASDCELPMDGTGETSNELDLEGVDCIRGVKPPSEGVGDG